MLFTKKIPTITCPPYSVLLARIINRQSPNNEVVYYANKLKLRKLVQAVDLIQEDLQEAIIQDFE